MIKRSTWVMVVSLAILAGLAYYLQQPDNLIKKALAPATTPTAEPLSPLFSSTDGPLNGISIQSADGQSAAIERRSTGWTLVIGNESSVPADQTVAEQVATQAQGLRPLIKIEADTLDLSAFGLDTPAYICKFVLTDSSSVTFKIGDLTPTGDGYYLQKEDGSVVVVEKYGMDAVINLLAQPPYMFTPTPSALPATGTPTPTAALNNISEPGSGSTVTPVTELTPTKKP
jgi:hypothetical protein